MSHGRLNLFRIPKTLDEIHEDDLVDDSVVHDCIPAEVTQNHRQSKMTAHEILLSISPMLYHAALDKPLFSDLSEDLKAEINVLGSHLMLFHQRIKATHHNPLIANQVIDTISATFKDVRSFDQYIVVSLALIKTKWLQNDANQMLTYMYHAAVASLQKMSAKQLRSIRQPEIENEIVGPAHVPNRMPLVQPNREKLIKHRNIFFPDKENLYFIPADTLQTSVQPSLTNIFKLNQANPGVSQNQSLVLSSPDVGDSSVLLFRLQRDIQDFAITFLINGVNIEEMDQNYLTQKINLLRNKPLGLNINLLGVETDFINKLKVSLSPKSFTQLARQYSPELLHLLNGLTNRASHNMILSLVELEDELYFTLESNYLYVFSQDHRRDNSNYWKLKTDIKYWGVFTSTGIQVEAVSSDCVLGAMALMQDPHAVFQQLIMLINHNEESLRHKQNKLDVGMGRGQTSHEAIEKLLGHIQAFKYGKVNFREFSAALNDIKDMDIPSTSKMGSFLNVIANTPSSTRILINTFQKKIDKIEHRLKAHYQYLRSESLQESDKQSVNVPKL